MARRLLRRLLQRQQKPAFTAGSRFACPALKEPRRCWPPLGFPEAAGRPIAAVTPSGCRAISSPKGQSLPPGRPLNRGEVPRSRGGRSRRQPLSLQRRERVPSWTPARARGCLSFGRSHMGRGGWRFYTGLINACCCFVLFCFFFSFSLLSLGWIQADSVQS